MDLVADSMTRSGNHDQLIWDLRRWAMACKILLWDATHVTTAKKNCTTFINQSLAWVVPTSISLTLGFIILISLSMLNVIGGSLLAISKVWY